MPCPTPGCGYTGPTAQQPSCVTVKLTLRSMQLWVLSGSDQRAKVQMEDVILIVHNMPASSSQRLGPVSLQSSNMDLTLDAVSLRVYGAGKSSLHSI